MTGEEEEARERQAWQGALEFVLCVGLCLMIYALGSFYWESCQP